MHYRCIALLQPSNQPSAVADCSYNTDQTSAAYCTACSSLTRGTCQLSDSTSPTTHVVLAALTTSCMSSCAASRTSSDGSSTGTRPMRHTSTGSSPDSIGPGSAAASRDTQNPQTDTQKGFRRRVQLVCWVPQPVPSRGSTGAPLAPAAAPTALGQGLQQQTQTCRNTAHGKNC